MADCKSATEGAFCASVTEPSPFDPFSSIGIDLDLAWASYQAAQNTMWEAEKQAAVWDFVSADRDKGCMAGKMLVAAGAGGVGGAGVGVLAGPGAPVTVPTFSAAGAALGGGAAGVGGWFTCMKGNGGGTGSGPADEERQLQAKFKHAEDFGVKDKWSKAAGQRFKEAIQRHIGDPGTTTISGTYRGEPVTHYVNPQTGLNVMKDQYGNFLSGWKLNPQQLQNVLTRGSL